MDLPLCGRQVRLSVIARRFRCGGVLCGRQIFTERFAGDVLAPSARRTARLESLVHHLGLALGGRPGAGFAQRLVMPVSNDTLLRVVRRRARLPVERPTVIGIDDWAWRRNHRYGTIVCDLERRRIVTLLPDREQATAEAWLADHPDIAVVARDRGGGYGEAAAKALPRAIQVADRWHLMENASRAFLDAVRKSMRQIRSVIGATSINPDLLTCAERIQYDGYLHREETNAAILALSKSGLPIKRIARQTGSTNHPPGDPWRALGRVPGSAKLAGAIPALARRPMDRRLPQRRKSLATSPITGLSRVGTCGRRVGDATTAIGKRQCRKPSTSTIGTHPRAIDDQWKRRLVEGRHNHDRRD
jgi:hypothetical protein